MIHSINFVAKCRNIDPEKLTEFALKNEGRYSITPSDDGPQIGSAMVYLLVSDFQALQAGTSCLVATKPDADTSSRT